MVDRKIDGNSQHPLSSWNHLEDGVGALNVWSTPDGFASMPGCSSISPQSTKEVKIFSIPLSDFESSETTSQDARVRRLVRMMGHYHLYTAGHQVRTARLALALTQEMRWSFGSIKNTTTAALLHDMGKLGVSLSILDKEESLTDEEYKEAQTHVLKGVQLLEQQSIDPQIIKKVEQHHERIDGSGYPYGLNADSIGLGAHVLAFVDMVDVRLFGRPYVKPVNLEEIEEIADKLRLITFYPMVVNAFKRILERGGVEEIYLPSRAPLILRKEEIQRIFGVNLDHRPC